MRWRQVRRRSPSAKRSSSLSAAGRQHWKRRGLRPLAGLRFSRPLPLKRLASPQDSVDRSFSGVGERSEVAHFAPRTRLMFAVEVEMDAFDADSSRPVRLGLGPNIAE